MIFKALKNYSSRDTVPLRNMTKFNLANFHHVKHSLRVDDEDLVRAKTDPRARMKKVNPETRSVENKDEFTQNSNVKNFSIRLRIINLLQACQL